MFTKDIMFHVSFKIDNQFYVIDFKGCYVPMCIGWCREFMQHVNAICGFVGMKFKEFRMLTDHISISYDNGDYIEQSVYFER